MSPKNVQIPRGYRQKTQRPRQALPMEEAHYTCANVECNDFSALIKFSQTLREMPGLQLASPGGLAGPLADLVVGSRRVWAQCGWKVCQLAQVGFSWAWFEWPGPLADLAVGGCGLSAGW